jgi:hypothetical protein
MERRIVQACEIWEPHKDVAKSNVEPTMEYFEARRRIQLLWDPEFSLTAEQIRRQKYGALYSFNAANRAAAEIVRNAGSMDDALRGAVPEAGGKGKGGGIPPNAAKGEKGKGGGFPPNAEKGGKGKGGGLPPDAKGDGKGKQRARTPKGKGKDLPPDAKGDGKGKQRARTPKGKGKGDGKGGGRDAPANVMHVGVRGPFGHAVPVDQQRVGPYGPTVAAPDVVAPARVRRDFAALNYPREAANGGGAVAPPAAPGGGVVAPPAGDDVVDADPFAAMAAASDTPSAATLAANLNPPGINLIDGRAAPEPAGPIGAWRRNRSKGSGRSDPQQDPGNWRWVVQGDGSSAWWEYTGPPASWWSDSQDWSQGGWGTSAPASYWEYSYPTETPRGSVGEDWYV